MRLSTMWSVDQTIAADGTSPIATELAAPWRPDAPPTFFRSSANFVYRVTLAGRLCYLRFAPAEDGRSAAAVADELEIMQRVTPSGIATPEPVLTAAGNLISTGTVDGTSYLVVVLAALPGAEFDADDLDVRRCRAWGALAATLQSRLGDLADLGAHRASWSEQLADLECWSATAPPVVRAELTTLAEELHTWPTGPGYGLVHLDLELDNLRWIGDQPSVLDFDDAARHWHAVDVASAIRDLEDRPTLREEFLRGYEDAGGTHVRDRLPVARRWLELTAYARIAKSLDLDPHQDHPDWLRGLHGRLGERQRNYEAALLARA